MISSTQESSPASVHSARILERYGATARTVIETIDARAVEDLGLRLAHLLAAGNRLFIAGNGGSAAQAQHLAGELVSGFGSQRRGLGAVALTTDTSVLTAIANDYGYEQVFARQVAALASPGDAFLGFSTSGRSDSILVAAATARELGLITVAFTGQHPNPLSMAVEMPLCVDCVETEHIQEAHLVMVHMMCRVINDALR